MWTAAMNLQETKATITELLQMVQVQRQLIADMEAMRLD
jgi:hypothetical protein